MRVIDLGLTDFSEAYRFQMEGLKELAEGPSEDILFLTEHLPVITIGRRGSWSSIMVPENFLSSRGIKILNVDRGGDATYHGPGQLVAYPVFKLQNEGRDIHNFLGFLETVGTNFLSQYGLASEIKPGLRGIWIEGKKIGSIGIGIKKWVTYHGIAININTDLIPFSFIKPCGLNGVEVTSLKNILHRELDINEAKDRLKSSFREVSLLAEKVNKV